MSHLLEDPVKGHITEDRRRKIAQHPAGIEPTTSCYKACALPLCYNRCPSSLYYINVILSSEGSWPEQFRRWLRRQDRPRGWWSASWWPRRRTGASWAWPSAARTTAPRRPPRSSSRTRRAAARECRDLQRKWHFNWRARLFLNRPDSKVVHFQKLNSCDQQIFRQTTFLLFANLGPCVTNSCRHKPVRNSARASRARHKLC